MFTKKELEASPKIYCQITVNSKTNIPNVNFYGLFAFKSVNKFLARVEKRNVEGKNSYLNLDEIYHFLANENFTPVSDTFFYRDMEKRDQLSLS